MSICEKCGTEFETEKCPNCETVEEMNHPVEEQPVVEQPVAEQPVAEQSAPKKKKGLIIGIIVAVIAVIAAVVLALVLGGGGSGTEKDAAERYTVYIRDNSAYYLDAGAEQPILIAENIYKNEEDATLSSVSNYAFMFTAKDKKVFYPQKIELTKTTDSEYYTWWDASFALYYKWLNKPEEQPVKIAEGVTQYTVSADGENVIYIDAEDNLYHHNMTERNKLLSEVDSYWVSKDCQTIMYLSEDGGLYLQPIGGEKDKFDSDVTAVEKYNDDLTEVYYFKEETGSLYVKKAGADKVKISDDVDANSIKIMENGGVYFAKVAKDEDAAVVTNTLYDFIDDPESLVTKDENLLDSGNKKNVDAWNEMLYRKWTRDELQDRDAAYAMTSLYYFNGETATNICEYSEILDNCDDAIIISAYKNVDIKKVSIQDFVDAIDEKEGIRAASTLYQSTFSNYDYFDEFEESIKKAYEDAAAWYMIKDGVTLEIDPSEDVAGKMFISPDADKVFYYTNLDEEKDIADLRVITITEGAVASDELYDTELTFEEYEFDDLGRLLYSKNYRTEPKTCYDFYMDKVLVEYDIGGYEVLENGSVLYYTPDYEEAYLYNNGAKAKLTDDFNTIYEGADDIIYYLNNYSDQSKKADLFSYVNGESKRVDYDVADVIQFNSNRKYMYVLAWEFYF